jgi:tRNA threonylcarbamoyladenosine biosynthesis protein TsaB
VPSDRGVASGSPAGPHILALDTTGSACSVAVSAADTLLSVCSQAMLHRQAEALLPMVDAAMRAAAMPVSALDLVAATVGPGSFTGIRVGLAAARGIAFATGLPLVGVTGFEATAACVSRARNADTHHLLVALESRRAEIYVQLFALDEPLGEPAAVLPEALAGWIAARCRALPLLAAGDAAHRAAVALAGRPLMTVSEDLTPVAVGVMRRALSRWRPGERPQRTAPLYLRLPDVTLPRTHAGTGGS